MYLCSFSPLAVAVTKTPPFSVPLWQKRRSPGHIGGIVFMNVQMGKGDPPVAPTCANGARAWFFGLGIVDCRIQIGGDNMHQSDKTCRGGRPGRPLLMRDKRYGAGNNAGSRTPDNPQTQRQSGADDRESSEVRPLAA